MELIDTLLKSTPKCLKEFETSDSEKVIKDKFHLTKEFTSRKITCGCGNSGLLLQAYKTSETKGFFKKTIEGSFGAPGFIVCLKCENRSLIFDPRQHGWDGEMGENYSIVEEGELVTVKPETDNIYVYFSYQNPENYEYFEPDGINNPEDYFDMFGIVFGANEELIFEYECA